MGTLKKSTGTQSSDLMSSAVATPVSLSVRQGNGEVKKIRVTYGRGFERPLADYDPDTRCWKMFGDTSLWEGPPLLENLPPSGMTRNGVLYQQPPWEPLTGEIESSLWPTPTAVTRAMEGNVRLYRSKVQAGEMTEAEAEAILGKSVWEAHSKIPAMWPTPTYGKLAGGTGGMQQIEAQYSAGNITAEERRAMRAGNGGKLNPEWVEWLMGFPTGWTDLED